MILFLKHVSCYNNVTLLEGCYKGDTRVLQGCYRGVTEALHGVTGVIQGVDKGVAELLQGITFFSRNLCGIFWTQKSLVARSLVCQWNEQTCRICREELPNPIKQREEKLEN